MASKLSFAGRGFAISYRIQCTDNAAASFVLNQCYEEPHKYNETVALRSRRARSANERLVGRALGSLWTRIHDNLVERGIWDRAYKQGTDPAKGVLYLVVGDVATRLFLATVENSGGVAIERCTGIDRLGIDAAKVSEWTDEAAESAKLRL